MKDNSLIQIRIISNLLFRNEKQLTPDFFSFWWQDDEVSHENIPLKKLERKSYCVSLCHKEGDQFLGLDPQAGSISFIKAYRQRISSAFLHHVHFYSSQVTTKEWKMIICFPSYFMAITSWEGLKSHTIVSLLYFTTG